MLKKVPHTYVIIFILIAISALLTLFVPGGEFNRETIIVNGTEREVVDSQSFHYIDSQQQSWQIFSALFDGFENTAHIIAFILIIGGAFWIVNNSRSVDLGILTFIRFTDKMEHLKLIRFLGANNIILISTILIFSLFGAVFGMSEETIAFIVIFVPLAISMGYDSIVGVSICFVAAALGFAGAMLNPFTVGIAQGLSGIPLFTGIEYRTFAWIVITLFGIFWILRYANKVKKDPEQSPVYTVDNYWREKGVGQNTSITFFVKKAAWIVYALISIALILFSLYFPYSEMNIGNSQIKLPAIPLASTLFILTSFFTLRKTVHFFILNMLTFTIVFLIIGVMGHEWYIKEIATLFLALGIASGVAYGKAANDISKLFIEGAKDILPAAIVVGLANGIIVILTDGKILDTILYAISSGMNDFGKVGSITTMYFVQTLINIFIPSGSGQAAITMPLMSQIADLVGISRQAAVLAFQFGDGFTNMITPTSPVLIAVLGVAKIPYEKWFSWMWKFIIALTLLGLLLLIPAVTMNLNGF